jgi:type I restriction enzyme, R subunit
MSFNENSRVKIPAILHLCRLGYEYLSLKGATRDESSNIFTKLFSESISRINPDLDESGINRLMEDISLALGNEDLGEAFYRMLTARSGTKLIDFSDFGNNSFHVVTELTCKNGEDEFRPDITLLINGMPLAVIEVKIPDNQGGILKERDRMVVRCKNKKFRRFINITQLMMFSNNCEYDLDAVEPINGAFYSSTSAGEIRFNFFREEEPLDLSVLLQPDDPAIEDLVLKDNNLNVIKHSPEFITNKEPITPTNRLLTSLFSRERLAFFLRYCLAYVQEANGVEKHVMRYPQMFATNAIRQTLENGIKKGIIWHTQGSGKTALSYYNIHYLTDWFQAKGIVPKFYFIVDRIDLMDQAKREFSIRGLIVHTVNSKDELLKSFRERKAIHNLSGKREVTVVNIQKFHDDGGLLQGKDYDISIQRVYFLDEVHRSYNPNGSFLANLINSDREAILIGLTGTPLIMADRRSSDVFGDYIHKYYYNASIADGYTLRLIREGIETNYKIQLEQALKDVEILQGDADKKVIFAHEKFVEPMLDYIVEDFINSRIRLADHTIGGMVVCDSAEQARRLFDIFIAKYNSEQKTVEEVATEYLHVAEPVVAYGEYLKKRKNKLTASLILHDVGSKEDRKDEVDDFKAGKIDFLFVFGMLLTGFDAKRLKKLYLGRIVRDHNLLQTLTRVNRPYKKFRYGFVVDFADIRKEFDATNKAYFEELQAELGDELGTYSNLFKTREEIDTEISDIKERLFHYDLTNAEIFSRQIGRIQDRETVLGIKKALENARNLYNIIRLLGHFELLEQTDFTKLNQLYREAARHLEMLNLRESVQNSVDTTNLLNVALENVLFMFRKVSEEELVIADKLKDMLRRTREALGSNFDRKDPEFISLYDELKRLFDKRNLDEITQDEMKQNIGSLQLIFDKVAELNRRNNLLKAKYENDAKYARIHKRLVEKGNVSKRDSAIHATLIGIKQKADEQVLLNARLLENDAYFGKMVMPMVIDGFSRSKIELNPETAFFINSCVTQEYLNEFRGAAAW